MMKNLGIKKVQLSDSPEMIFQKKNHKASWVNIWLVSMKIARAIINKIASKCWSNCKFWWPKEINAKNSFWRSKDDQINYLFYLRLSYNNKNTSNLKKIIVNIRKMLIYEVSKRILVHHYLMAHFWRYYTYMFTLTLNSILWLLRFHFLQTQLWSNL